MIGDEPDKADDTAAAGNDDVSSESAAGDSMDYAGAGDSGTPDDSDIVQGEPAAVESDDVVPVDDESKNSADESTVTAPAAGADLESIVRDVLTRTYSRYWHTDDNEAVEQVVAILNDPALVNHPRFEAASRVRIVLWKNTSLGGPSAVATCNVFFAVGRESEVGPVAREAAHFAEGILY